MSPRCVPATVVLFLIALLPTAVSGLAGTSTIAGIVKDATNAPLPGVTVTVVGDASGATFEAVSDERGAYRTDALAPGAYRVQTALDGFEPSVIRIVLEAGEAAAGGATRTPGRPTEKAGVSLPRGGKGGPGVAARARSAAAGGSPAGTLGAAVHPCEGGSPCERMRL